MTDVYDIVIAGGGTVASVIAGRLAAADPSLKIVVVESGQHTRDVARIVQPCRSVENLAPDSTTLSFYVAKPNPNLNGRAVVVPSGRCIGGGSAVNFLIYMRGSKSDFDDWSALGNKGWSFEELLPLMEKLEDFTPLANKPTHGYTGPVNVSVGGIALGIGRQFLDVAEKYDPNRPVVDDLTNFTLTTANAYSPAYKYIVKGDGKRSDAASRYLYPQSEKQNSNLKIIVGHRVKRVIFENGRAAGIEYTTEGGSGEVVTAKASKQVVLSAGAFGSPSILERSGIGAESILKNNNIPVVVDLPGVGENFQDHLGVCPVFYASDDTDTMDDVWSSEEAIAKWLPQWEKDGTGKVAHNGIEACVKVRPTEEQVKSAGPALQKRWESYFKDRTDKPLGMIIPFAGSPLDPSQSALLGRKLFSAFYLMMHPESVGKVHIMCGGNVNLPLEFDPNYCSKAGDVDQLILFYKITREIARRMSAYRGEVPTYHPQFPPGSPAACKETDGPVPIDAPDIVYSDADTKAIEKFIRDRVFTTWQALGTCAMKPRDQDGVVDARLNVYGVQGLKVADLSVCPGNVGNNTNATALLVGEKAAAIIAEDLGIKYT